MPATAQDLQAPVQLVAQQTPSAQTPLVQSAAAAQAAPLALAVPIAQRRAASPSACPAVVNTDAVVSSRKNATRRAGAFKPTI
jgi:hypothetical protein